MKMFPPAISREVDKMWIKAEEGQQ